MYLFSIFLALVLISGTVVRVLRRNRVWIFEVKRETHAILPTNAEAGGYHLLLEKHVDYYRKLSSVDKQQFIFRVHTYLKRVKIEGRQGLVLEPVMPVLVAASCIQLTFGLDLYVFDKFKQIYLYPDAFKLNNSNVELQGLTNPKGIIALSWKTLKKSFEVHDDNRHLGLHEMAHALRFNGKLGGGEDAGFEKFMPLWEQQALPVFRNINTDNDYLRNYAAENPEEFFAVCMEQFFETPQRFYAEHPQLYRATCLLLNQDPNAPAEARRNVRIQTR